MNNLLKFWNTTSDRPPFVHKKDISIVNIKPFINYEVYINAYTNSETRADDLHSGLFPVPHIGDIRNANLFILMLNPGFSHEDYIAENHFPSFRRALKDNLKQNKMPYPFLFLNPDFLWTGGGHYWEKRFGVYAKALSDQQHITYGEALRVISNRIACLELVPYHSKDGVNNDTIIHLESVKVMLDFFHSDILPKAKKGEVGLIVARGRRHWMRGQEIVEQDNIVVYSNGEERSASIAPKTRGGRVVEQFLLRNHGSRIV